MINSRYKDIVGTGLDILFYYLSFRTTYIRPLLGAWYVPLEFRENSRGQGSLSPGPVLMYIGGEEGSGMVPALSLSKLGENVLKEKFHAVYMSFPTLHPVPDEQGFV